MRTGSILLLAGLCAVYHPGVSTAQTPSTVSIVLDGKAPRTEIPKTLYGIFFEEINHSGEGGVYAEMVQNRDFEVNALPAGAEWAGNLIKTKNGWWERKGFGNELWGWKLEESGGAIGQIRQVADHPLNESNPHSLRLTVVRPGTSLAIINGGFWGMHFSAGHEYGLSFYARTEHGDRFDATASLEGANGREVYAKVPILGIGGEWKQYRAVLTPSQDETEGRLAIKVKGYGAIWFDIVSLFPKDTYNRRPNGCRADIVEVLKALHPAFMRFPGGAVTGGLNLDDRFQWKHSIGDIARRKGMFDLWGYYSTNGLGFHEYLQLIEDLGADGLYVCNPGFSDNYRHAEYASPAEVPAFVQESMDAIEYAIGAPNSHWGAMRSANGHPEPFPLKYIEIGNETSGDIYLTNYRQFYSAIKRKYPRLTIIAAGPIKGAGTDMIDVHEYGSPAKLYNDWTRFDSADRSGPKIYVGEFAASDGVGEGDLECALGEAAYMLGIERNSDIVRMASYAPLLANVNDNAWPVNMIRFDAFRVAPRSSYYVQKLFANNRPDFVIKTITYPAPGPAAAGVYALGGWDETRREVVLKVINRARRPQDVAIEMRGLPGASGAVCMTTLSNPGPNSENTVDAPDMVVPQKTEVPATGHTFAYTLTANSLTVMRFATSDHGRTRGALRPLR